MATLLLVLSYSGERIPEPVLTTCLMFRWPEYKGEDDGTMSLLHDLAGLALSKKVRYNTSDQP